MEIRLSGMVNDSIVDGPGLRLTIFTQGCHHNCPGCHNPDTHTKNGGTIYKTETIFQTMKENPLLDGITLSGGEPFLQAEACALLAEFAHRIHLNVWTYTGYTLEELFAMKDKNILRLLANTDVLVDGRFEIKNRSIDLLFRGSKNQRILDMKKSLAEKKAVLFPI